MRTIYKQEIKKSLKQLKLKLILPDIIFFLVGILMLATFSNLLGLSDITPEVAEAGLEQYISANIGGLMGLLLVFVLIAFFVGAALKAFKLKMILESVNGKPVSLIDSLKGSHRYYWRIILLKILSFIILLASFVVAGAVFMLLRNVFELLAWVAAVFILLYVVLALLLKEAALFQSNVHASEAIAYSFKQFTKNKLLIFGLLAIIVIVNVVFAVLTSVFPESQSILGVTISAIFLIIMLLISAWGNLLTFNVYKNLSASKVNKKPKTTRKKVSKKSKR